MVLPQLLEMADIFVAHRVALAEGRALELPGPDLGNVVRQLGPHRILQIDFFHHVSRSFQSKEVDFFFVGAASCRDLVVAGSHSHKEQAFLSIEWRRTSWST
jgi:hypothetical protein